MIFASLALAFTVNPVTNDANGLMQSIPIEVMWAALGVGMIVFGVAALAFGVSGLADIYKSEIKWGG